MSKQKSIFHRILQAKVVQVSGKINTFIVGVQKGGTSSLFNFLLKSPEAVGTVAKEVMYFSHDKNYSKGDQWYHDQFKQPLIRFGLKNRCILDATPEYMYYTNCAARIHQYNPEARIIFILREPVSRAFSHWNMYRQFYQTNQENHWLFDRHLSLLDSKLAKPLITLFKKEKWPSFEECIEMEMKNELNSQEPSFVRRGLYAEQIERFRSYFPEEQIFIGFTEDLKSNRKKFLDQLVDFLGIDLPDLTATENKHEREYPLSIENKTKEQLTEFYAPHNERLKVMLQKELPW